MCASPAAFKQALGFGVKIVDGPTTVSITAPIIDEDETTAMNNVTINGETFQLPDNIVGAVMFDANGTVNAWSTEQYNIADRAQAARAELLTTIMELQIRNAQLVSKDMQPHALTLDEKNRKIAELSAKATSSQDTVRRLTRELEDLLKRVPSVRSLPLPDRVKDIVDAFRDLGETELDDLGKRLDATAYGNDWKMRLMLRAYYTGDNTAYDD